MMINIFLILFLFDIRYIKSLSDLKNFGNLSLLNIYLILLLLSFSGIPPFLGFIGKFLIFIFIFYSNNIFIFIFFVLTNFFVIYFYIQNLKFLVSSEISKKFIIINNYYYWNINIVFFLNIMNFFNLFSLFFFNNMYIYVDYVNSFINI